MKGNTCHKDRGHRKWEIKLKMGVGSKHDFDLTKMWTIIYRYDVNRWTRC